MKSGNLATFNICGLDYCTLYILCIYCILVCIIQELRQWSSHDNDIVAAAKRMAILMASLSQLVRGEGGNKKDLIDTAKAIADSSEEVTRLAVQLARQCTDIKMRMVSFL